ncbi:MAG: hypothetical protein JSS98_13455 [Bacteroidetes bacterium]|nr:hypothetical protein [Bacteroidota bacterium]
MIKQYLLFFILVFFICFGYAQVPEKFYNFINNELPPTPFGKSSWGIFYLNRPATIDSSTIQKIKDKKFDHIPEAIKIEFLDQLNNLDSASRNFIWKQSYVTHFILVNSIKEHLSSKNILPQLPAAMRSKAAQWISVWNRVKLNERLFNYGSIPFFSKDHQYIMFLRGQSASGEGWDTIYFYQKKNGKWSIADYLIITSI